MIIDRKTMIDLIYGGRAGRRFTQDSPVLPDVWIAYAAHPNQKIDLLLTPFQKSNSGDSTTSADLERILRERLAADESARPDGRKRPQARARAKSASPAAPAAIAHNQSTVVAFLSLDEVVRVVLPMSDWWSRRVCGGSSGKSGKRTTGGRRPKPKFDLIRALRRDKAALVEALKHSAELAVSVLSDRPSPVRTENPWRAPAERATSKVGVPDDVLWMLRVIGTLLIARDEPGEGSWQPPNAGRLKHFEQVVARVDRLLAGFRPGDACEPAVYAASLNRQARLSIWRSSTAIKADAVRRLFNVSCADLAWAVVDSGIDAEHPAFRKRMAGADGKIQPIASPFERDGQTWRNNTRVLATYDFRIIRHLLSGDPGALRHLPRESRRRFNRQWPTAEEFRKALLVGRMLNWDLIAPILQMPHDDDYRAPRYEHGTHVAGILAGNWPAGDADAIQDDSLVGICPDINLYDLRAFDDEGVGDEFTVMAALQFVRHLNANKDYMAVQGINLSLSIPHDIANYACGATPVCVEAERLVGAGMVVVAAAGNDGYLHYATNDGAGYDGYHSISVTDPGNAEGVITVGSTHRDSPHTYGVSYFSSRGPTGDGRNKPDLVAPGEKIEGPVPGRGIKRMDGTSMAAPHVSGAAALLLARYTELIGRPARVKQILCKSATDLGRERYFQGSGMLDVLRAMQSV